ncbi:hypothetical protein Tco_1204848 [Tanacetum coccineum]
MSSVVSGAVFAAAMVKVEDSGGYLLLILNSFMFVQGKFCRYQLGYKERSAEQGGQMIDTWDIKSKVPLLIEVNIRWPRHNHFLSSRVTGILEIKDSLLQELGVRLVSYDLPGFGESDKFWVVGY